MLTLDQKDRIKNLYDQGFNPEDISEETGYDEIDVMEYCAEILYDEEL